jgi:hypothetical protein
VTRISESTVIYLVKGFFTHIGCNWVHEIPSNTVNIRLQPFSFHLHEIGIYMDMVNGNRLNCLYLIYERPLLKNCKYVPKPLA